MAIWTDWRLAGSSQPRLAAWVAAATRRADPASISLFVLYFLLVTKRCTYILFGTKDRAQAGVVPCTGQRGGQNLPVSRRGTRSRNCVTRGKDTDGLQRQRHRRQ